MARVIGIDPGTKSLDVCGLEEGEVFYERSLETVEVARDPGALIKAVEEAMPLDLIVGPSGYGVELTYLSDIPSELLEEWYYTYVLLTTKGAVEEAIRRGSTGAFIYYAMTQVVKEMKRRNLPVCFIPGVIHLPTVPPHRKLNKIDMGTADKLCVCMLGVHDQAERLKLPYSEVSFIQVEMGFGYNAVMGVNGGVVVDGFGGTTMLGPGFLTMSYADLELVQLVGSWEKADVFTGGCITIAEAPSPEAFIESIDRSDRCRLAWEAMIEGVEKAVGAMLVSVPKPREILLSGRLVRVPRVFEELTKRLSKYAPVRRVSPLKGARVTKETAQGYAVVADGLAGGPFKGLIDHVKLREAKGSALDYVYHPKIQGVRSKLVPLKPWLSGQP
ncbi:MAG: DUF1464 family protein [Candidatus Nezhaarchaeota archaeon]|nr:DUF1464 family protein [Candidatus Nezhaarchaeota archaeon]